MLSGYRTVFINFAFFRYLGYNGVLEHEFRQSVEETFKVIQLIQPNQPCSKLIIRSLRLNFGDCLSAWLGDNLLVNTIPLLSGISRLTLRAAH